MAGRIPQSFIDDLMARTDIVELIGERVPLKKAGKDYTACCPFHNEKTPSFSVVPNKQFFHCFGCGAHGTALGFVMEYDRLSFVDAVEALAERLHIPVPREGGGGSEDGGQYKRLYEVMEQANTWFQSQLRSHVEAPQAIDYLKKRGLSGEVAKSFGLGYSPSEWTGLADGLGREQELRKLLLAGGLLKQHESGRVYDLYRSRIIFPIRDRRGRVIGFGGRVLDKSEPKYLNSPETEIFHKGRELYGLYEARQANRKLERVLVVEGYMDVVALAQFGITNAVATLGTSTTSDHVQVLFRTVSEIVFCFDGDRAGRAAGWRALENTLPNLQDGRAVRFMFLPEGEDPDSLVRQIGKDGFEALMREAMPLSQFLFDKLAQDIDIKSLDGRAQLLAKLNPLVSSIPGTIYRQMLDDEVKRRLGMGERPVEERPRAPQRHHAQHEARQQPSLVRKALKALLERPELARRLPDTALLRELHLPGLPLLCSVLDFLREQPAASTAQLLERWRGTTEGEHLTKLAAREALLPDDALERELLDTIAQLLGQARAQGIERLQAKARLSGLSPEEKRELAQLLTSRA
ncbi:MAG: DNA primase [Gammaproteobacteria bacterium]|nr:DNA primase [Gammaproteobacteria bacterium]